MESIKCRQHKVFIEIRYKCECGVDFRNIIESLEYFKTMHKMNNEPILSSFIEINISRKYLHLFLSIKISKENVC